MLVGSKHGTHSHGCQTATAFGQDVLAAPPAPPQYSLAFCIRVYFGRERGGTGLLLTKGEAIVNLSGLPINARSLNIARHSLVYQLFGAQQFCFVPCLPGT